MAMYLEPRCAPSKTAARFRTFRRRIGAAAVLCIAGFGTAHATLVAPTATTSFSPSVVYIGPVDPSQLTITLTNPNPQQIDGVSISDAYPSGILNLDPNVLANTCNGATQLLANGSSLGLTGGTIQGNASCQIVVRVWGLTEGTWTNATGTITSSNAPDGASASANIEVNRFAAPMVTKAFLPANVIVGGTSQLQIVLTNPNVSDITGATVDDPYPPGISNKSTGAIVSNTCGGTLTAQPFTSSMHLANGIVPANGSCMIAIDVTGSITGTNVTDPVSSTNADDGNPASATLTATPSAPLGAPTVDEAISPSTFQVGGTADITITLSNMANAQPIAGLQLHDVFPTQIITASGASALHTSTCNGTFTAPENGNFIDLVNGAIPAGGSCVIKVRVLGVAPIATTNQTGPVSSANAVTAAGAQANFAVQNTALQSAPTLSKSFSPAAIAVGQPSQMKIALTNANALAVVGLNLNDVYPQGIANAPSGALVSNTCGGVINTLGDGFTGSTALFLNSGTVPGNGQCNIVVNVVGTKIGDSIVNTIGASTSNTLQPADASGSLTVTPKPPVIGKAFSPAQVTSGGVSEMSISIANPNVQAITGVAFTDTYPAGIVNLASGQGVLVNNTCNGSITADPMGSSLELSGGSIQPNSTCEIDIAILATGTGSIQNDTGPVHSNDAPDGVHAQATLAISGGSLLLAPTVAKSFTPSAVIAGGTTQMTFTLRNANGTDITGVQFADPYPPGIKNAPDGIVGNSVLVSNTCGGTVTALINTASSSLVNGQIPAGSICNIVINVVGTATATNQTTQLFSANASTGTPASGVLTVNPGPWLNPPIVSKAFSPTSTNLGAGSQMTISLTNPNASPITGAQVNDIYPPGLANAANAPVLSDDCNFVEDVPSSGAWAKFANGTIPPGGCSVVIAVLATKSGNQINVTGTVPSANAQSGASKSATLSVNGGPMLPAPTVTKSFAPATVLVGGTSQMTIALANSDPSTSIVGVAFNDSYPLPLHMANAPGGALIENTCGGTVDAVDGGTSVSLSGGIIPKSGSCHVVVNVVGTSTGSSINHTNPVTSTNASPGIDATSMLTVSPGNLRGAPTVLKTFSPTSVLPGGASQMTIKLTNNSTVVALSGLQVNDIYPAGLTNAPGNPLISDSCNFSHNVPAGGTWAKLANGSLPPSGSCSVVIGVIGAATSTNSSGPVLAANAHTGASSSATLTVNAGGVIPDLTLSKSHAGDFTQGQSGASYSIIVSNSGSAATSGLVTVTDTLPSALVATGMSGPGWSCNVQTLTCTRSDQLNIGNSYPAITLTVNVGANAPATLTNVATVGGGGETNTGNDSVGDPATIGAASAGPDLTLTKSHAGNFSQGQSGASYSLIVHNMGAAATTGVVTLTDALPPSLTAMNMAGPGWTCSSATKTCTRNDALPANASYPAITLTALVDANAPSLVTNSATVSGGGEVNTANDSANDPTTVAASSVTADLTLTKSHPGNFTQGQSGATYTLIAHNVGGAPTAGAVVVADALPAGLTVTGVGGTGWVCTTSPLSCTRSDPLANGASYPPITLTVSVAAGAPATVTNTATVSGGGESDTANDDAADPTTITPNGASSPDLTLAKSHVGHFSQGQSGAAYSLMVTNAGGTATSGIVTVADVLPSGLSASNLSGPGWTCNIQTLTCTRSDSLNSGSNYPAITLTVDVGAAAPPNLINTATVSGGGETNLANDAASDATAIDLASASADLTLTKSHAGNFSRGQTGAVYSLIAHNIGGAATSGTVTVSDTLPAALTATAIGGPGWTCTLSPLNCTRNDTLPTTASYPAISVTVDVANNAPSLVTNSATVSGGGDANGNNNSAADPTSIDPASAGADLTLTKSHAGNFSQGESGATYVLTVHNVGVIPSNGFLVTVTDTLPPSLTATSLSGNGWACNVAATTCTRSDTLGNGASYPPITLGVDVSANAPASVTNLATVSGGGDTDTSNNDAADPTTVVQGGGGNSPDMTLTKVHVGNFSQGQTNATYTLTAANTGTAPTGGVVTVNDTLPPSLTATNMSGPGWACDLASTTCTRADSLSNSSSYPAITLTVDVSPIAPPTVTNSATVSGGGETNLANDSTNDLTVIDVASGGADLSLSKTHGGNFAQGQTGAAYSLIATNVGSVATNGTVTVSDSLPPSLTPTTMGGPGWTCNVATTSCTRSDPVQGNASYPAITLTVNVALNAPPIVTNTATVSGGGEINTNNDGAADQTTIDPGATGADLTLTKAHAGTFSQGQSGASYTLTVHNVGGASTNGAISVTDALPPALVATAISGTGWACSLPTKTCTRSDILAANASYPPITLIANIAANAPASIINTAVVSGGGELNTNNDSASDPTSIQSTGGNHSPIAVGDAIEVTPNGTDQDLVGDPQLSDSLLDNDVDADAAVGDTLTAVKLSDPAHGTLLQFHADGTFTYQTNVSTGTDSFTYQACDTHNACSLPTKVTITIGTGLDNHLPFAVDDAGQVAHGGVTAGIIGDLQNPNSVLDNDIDPDGDPLVAIKLTDPAHGLLAFDGSNGTFTYQNDGADPATSDTFMYEACDSHGACDLGVVTLTIGSNAIDRAPIVVDDAMQVTPNPPGNSTSALIGDLIVPSSVLDNDIDPDAGDSLTVGKVGGLLNASGTIAVNTDGSFSYQNTVPSATSDMLLYQACDQMKACTAGVITISITNGPLDQLPIAMDDAIEVAPHGSTSSILGDAVVPNSVLHNDHDPDSPVLVAHLISAPAHGHVTLDPAGTFTYFNDDPNAGPDSWQYEACDPNGACVAATVSVTINAAAPTVTCTLPTQVDSVGDAVSIDLSLLFAPPAGQSLTYSGGNFPPSLSILGSLLTGTLQTSDLPNSPYHSTLKATTAPGGVSASENVTFQVLPTGEILFRNGFEDPSQQSACQ